MCARFSRLGTTKRESYPLAGVSTQDFPGSWLSNSPALPRPRRSQHHPQQAPWPSSPTLRRSSDVQGPLLRLRRGVPRRGAAPSPRGAVKAPPSRRYATPSRLRRARPKSQPRRHKSPRSSDSRSARRKARLRVSRWVTASQRSGRARASACHEAGRVPSNNLRRFIDAAVDAALVPSRPRVSQHRDVFPRPQALSPGGRPAAATPLPRPAR